MHNLIGNEAQLVCEAMTSGERSETSQETSEPIDLAAVEEAQRQLEEKRIRDSEAAKQFFSTWVSLGLTEQK